MLYRRLKLVAAVLFIALLVGSAFAVFSLAHKQQAAPGHPHPTERPQSPVASADEIYAIVNNTIYRYDSSTHRQIWSFPMPLPNHAENIGSQGQVVNGVLYTLGTGSDGYYSYAINTSSGTLRWRFKVQYQTSDLNLIADQLVANGLIYLSEASFVKGYSVITALDASTGAIRWQHRYNGTGIAYPQHFIDISAGLTLQAATSDTLYGTTFTGRGTTTLFAINARDGSLLWQKRVSTDGEQPDFSGGMVVNGVLCISASSTYQPGFLHLYGFDATTGEPKWSVPLDGQTQQFATLNGVVYLGTIHYRTASDNSVSIASGSLYAVRATDGARLWRYTTSAGFSAPVAQNGMVFASVSRQDVGKRQNIMAFDARTGAMRWTYPAPYELAFNPQLSVSKDRLYAGTTGGNVQILRLSDGQLLDTLSLPAPASGSPSAVIVLTVVP